MWYVLQKLSSLIELFFPVVASHKDILERVCVGVWRTLLIISKVSDISTTIRLFKEKKINPKKDGHEKS